MNRVLLLASVSAVLVGCGDHKDPEPVARCPAAPGSALVSVSVQQDCSPCSIDNVNHLTDGDYFSLSTVVVGASASNAGLVLTFASPDGSPGHTSIYDPVAVSWSNPTGAFCATITYSNDGAPLSAPDSPINRCFPADSIEFGFGSVPQQAFDTVEVLFYSQEASGSSTIPVNEVCPGF